MATQIIENGVYTNLQPTSVTGIGNSRIGNAGNPAQDLETGDTASKVINAVEIDWNGADLNTVINSLSSNVPEGVALSTVNTTGDLLKVIAQLQTQVNALTSLVKGLYNALA